MKIQFYFLALLILCCYGYTNAQRWNDCRTNNFNTARNYFQVDDLSFTVNYRGIRSYMNILAGEDPDLHQKLQPQFQLIQGKRNGAIASSVTVSAIGGILMLLALDDNSSDQIRFGRGASHPDVGLMLSGLMVMSIGGIIAVIFNPRENGFLDFLDFLDFFNLHNRNSKNQKIQWRMGLNVWGNNAQGIRLQLQF